MRMPFGIATFVAINAWAHRLFVIQVRKNIEEFTDQTLTHILQRKRILAHQPSMCTSLTAH
jgi:hypothetical protein